jgi:hypothetical protein
MKRWTIVVWVAALAGCAGPKVSLTDVSQRRVGFLVQDAWFIPMQDLDERAASHCGQHGLSYRRMDDVWISPTLKRVVYECSEAEGPLTRKLAVRRAAPRRAAMDPQVTAWTKAKAAIEAWAVCLRFDAERKANETTEAPRAVAQEVVAACAGLEHAVHAPLEAVGEDSPRFYGDLHEQAVEDASKAVTSVRMKTGVTIAGSPAF